MKIKDFITGLPAKTGTDLLVRVMPFETSATTCGLYYELHGELGMLANGNLQLTEEEFTNWAEDNTYIEDLALVKLGLERAEEVIEEPIEDEIPGPTE